MSGLPDFNYPAFNAAAELLRQRGYVVTNPAENFLGDTSLSRNAYLKKAFRQVICSQQVICLPGWQASEGAAAEVAIARALGLPVCEYRMGNLVEVGTESAGEPRTRFEELLDKVKALHNAKKSDYTGTSGDILHNYRTSARLAGITTSTGIFARLCEKVVRVSSILSKNGDTKVADESITDTCLDLSIISLLLLISLEERTGGAGQ